MSKDRRILKVRAPAEHVWRAFADPGMIKQWFADDASGEATPGETLTHVFEKFDMEMPYQVIEARPGELLVLEGTAPGGFPFRQEVHVRREGGDTVLELVHSGFEAPEDPADWSDEYEGMDSGWQLALAVLRHYLEQHFGRDKRGYFVMRPARLAYEQLRRLFRDQAGLATWLTRSGAIGADGSPVELALQGDRQLTGRVLADSGRELALSWEELRGTLELKAFAAGPGTRMVALRAFSWADDPPAVESIEDWMHSALERLVAALAR